MNDMDDIDMIDAGGRVYDTFYLLLAKMDSWDSFLNGTFEDQMVQQLRNENA